MTIEFLKKYFENEENPKFFLTDVFSWRGIYDEVAFIPSDKGSKEESILLINMALTETFRGYKGGNYTYDLNTKVHFEDDNSNYDDMELYMLLIYYIKNK